MRLTVFFALFAFAVMALAVAVPPGACPGQRDSLLDCFSQLADNDTNGNITVAELDAFIAMPCMPNNTAFTSVFNSSFVMTQCDVDMDGELTMADWNSADSCLRSNIPAVDYICRLCYGCGWVPTPVK